MQSMKLHVYSMFKNLMKRYFYFFSCYISISHLIVVILPEKQYFTVIFFPLLQFMIFCTDYFTRILQFTYPYCIYDIY